MAINPYLKQAMELPNAENLRKLYTFIEMAIVRSQSSKNTEEARRYKELELWLDMLGRHARNHHLNPPKTTKTTRNQQANQQGFDRVLKSFPEGFEKPNMQDIQKWTNEETSNFYDSRLAETMAGLENNKPDLQLSSFQPITASSQGSGAAETSNRAQAFNIAQQDSPLEAGNSTTSQFEAQQEHSDRSPLASADPNEAQQGSSIRSDPASTNPSEARQPSSNGSEPASTNQNGAQQGVSNRRPSKRGGLETSGTPIVKESSPNDDGGLFLDEENNGLNFDVDDQQSKSFCMSGKVLYRVRKGTANLFLIHEQDGKHSRYRLQKTGHDESDAPHIHEQSREHSRDRDNRKYGRSQFKHIKDVAWEDYSEDMMSLASIAFLWDDAPPGEERSPCRPKRGVKPVPHQPYPWTRCKIQWNDNVETWETRSFARKLTGTADMADQLIFYVAYKREEMFCKATRKPTCTIYDVEAAMCEDTEAWQEEHDKRWTEKMEANRRTVHSKVRPKGLEDIELNSNWKPQPKALQPPRQNQTNKELEAMVSSIVMEIMKRSGR